MGNPLGEVDLSYGTEQQQLQDNGYVRRKPVANNQIVDTSYGTEQQQLQDNGYARKIPAPAPSVSISYPAAATSPPITAPKSYGLVSTNPTFQTSQAAAEKTQATNDALNNVNSTYAGSLAQNASLYDLQANKANPYSMGNPGMLAQRALAKNQINSGYKTQAQQLREHLAQRGMLGTAQEDAATSGMGINALKDASQADTQLAANSYDKQQDFEGQRINSLADLTSQKMGIGNSYANLQANLAGQNIALQNLDMEAKKFEYGKAIDTRNFNYQQARDAITDANDKTRFDLLVRQYNDAQARQDNQEASSLWGSISKILLPVAGAGASFFLSGMNPAGAVAGYQLLNGVQTSWPGSTTPTVPTAPKVKSLTDLLNGGFSA